MTAHVHAALMAQYAEMATTTDKPYLHMQFQRNSDGEWQQLKKHPKWHSGTTYRFVMSDDNPQHPKPFEGTLEPGQEYYRVVRFSTVAPCEVTKAFNENPLFGREHVNSGMVHMTFEAANAHAQFLNGNAS